MSSIGSGPGIGTGHIELNGVRAIIGADARPVVTETNSGQSQPAATNTNQGAAMVTTTALNAGDVPVDHERVTQIRKAIQSGNYPILPAKISDAMIAARILLQVRN